MSALEREKVTARPAVITTVASASSVSSARPRRTQARARQIMIPIAR